MARLDKLPDHARLEAGVGVLEGGGALPGAPWPQLPGGVVQLPAQSGQRCLGPRPVVRLGAGPQGALPAGAA